MKVSILVGTYGGDEWKTLALNHAAANLHKQNAYQTIVSHDPDGTLASVRNQLAARAAGDWLCFLDADDQLADGYVAAMSDADHDEFETWAVTHPGEAYGFRLFVPAVNYRNLSTTPEIPSWGQPLIDVNCAVIGTLVSRVLFERVGGFRDLPMYEDWDLWLRSVIAGAVMVPVPRAVYLADSSPGRNTNPALATETYWRIRNEHEPAYRLATGT